MNKIITAALLIAAGLIFISAICTDESDACTGFYVGSDCTEDGSIIFGQSADVSPYMQIYYEIYEASNVPGRTVTGCNGFVYNLPEVTYRYTDSIFQDYITVNGNKIGIHAGGGSINSQGVACTGSITGSPSKSALAADPYVTTGLGEEQASAIVGACASSAREGVRILLDIIEKQGSSESNIYMVVDQKEAWYIEVYTGHQYAAVLLPTDGVIYTGNEFGLIYAQDYSEYILSDNLVKLAADNGFAVMKDGKLDIEASYSSGSSSGYSDSCHIRSWRARNILAPSSFSTYDINERYSLLFTPESKVSVEKIMSIMKDRNEGTEYSVDDGSDKYCIGNYNAVENHIIQVIKDLPKDRCCIKWGELGFPTFGVYIPYVVGVDSHICEYGTPSTDFATGTTMYDLVQRLYSLCDKNMNFYKNVIKTDRNEMQSYIFKTFDTVWKEYLSMSDRSKADSYITDYVLSLEKMTVDQTISIYNDISIWNLASSKYKGEYSDYACFNVNSTAERYGGHPRR